VSVRELTTGERGPISQYEFAMWNTYFKVKAYYAENQRDK